MSFGHLRTVPDFGTVKIVRFADGGLEITGRAAVVPEPDGFKAVPPPNASASIPDAERELENAERARRRRVQRVRHAIRHAQCDRLLTLTYRENMGDFNRLLSDWKKFTRVLRDVGSFVFVAVPERQKRGAWHLHIAVRGFKDVVFFRKVWHSIVGSGSVNIVYRRGSRSAWPSQRLAFYLSKYLGKTWDSDQESLHNRKRFFTSRGLTPPVELIQYSQEKWLDIIIRLVREYPQLSSWFVASDRPLFWASG